VRLFAIRFLFINSLSGCPYLLQKRKRSKDEYPNSRLGINPLHIADYEGSSVDCFYQAKT
jgi:hypothetical protein